MPGGYSPVHPSTKYVVLGCLLVVTGIALFFSLVFAVAAFWV